MNGRPDPLAALVWLLIIVGLLAFWIAVVAEIGRLLR